MLFDLPQEFITVDAVGKFNRRAALIVRRSCGRGAKFTHPQTPQPRQRRPPQLINHGRLLLRGRKTKKITSPKPSTIKSPMESAAKRFASFLLPTRRPSERLRAKIEIHEPPAATGIQTWPPPLEVGPSDGAANDPASACESTGTRQISRFTTSSALSSINLRRASTFHPSAS